MLEIQFESTLLLNTVNSLLNQSQKWSSLSKDVSYLNSCFLNLHKEDIRSHALPLCSFPLWTQLPSTFLKNILTQTQHTTQKRFKSVSKSLSRHQSSPMSSLPLKTQMSLIGSRLVPSICELFYSCLQSLLTFEDSSRHHVAFAEHCISLFRLLISMPSTRRFVLPFLESRGFLTFVRVSASKLSNNEGNTANLLLIRLMESFLTVADCAFNDVTGEELYSSSCHVMAAKRAQSLLIDCHVRAKEADVAFKDDFVRFSTVSLHVLLNFSECIDFINSFDSDFLSVLIDLLGFNLDDLSINENHREFYLPTIAHYLKLKQSMTSSLINHDTFPNEQMIWNYLQVPPTGPDVAQKLTCLPSLPITFQSLGMIDFF
ncbi:hypothetical protein GEMRC1_000873 [Eukaryota sp. GEM-RC1]